MKRKLSAKETDDGVAIVMDATYFYSLNTALKKSLYFGFDTHSDDYLDILDIIEEFKKIDVAI